MSLVKPTLKNIGLSAHIEQKSIVKSQLEVAEFVDCANKINKIINSVVGTELNNGTRAIISSFALRLFHLPSNTTKGCLSYKNYLPCPTFQMQ